MKKEAICLLSSCLFFACAGTGDQSKAIKIAKAYKKEGDVFQSQGNYTVALTKFLEAEKTMPSDPYLQNSLGLAYMGKKRYDLAVTAFTKALNYKKDYTEAMNNLGAAFLRQEKWDDAIFQFERVLEDIIYPTPHFPLVNIGWAYIGKQHYPKARHYFQMALVEKPMFVTALHGMAQTYIRTGQADRAIKYLHKKLKHSPDAVILHADLAHAYEKKSLIRQALKSWKVVLKLAPNNTALARKAEGRISMLQE